MQDNILLINENCNQDCIFCYNDKSKKCYDEDKILEKIRKFAEISIQKITITGGEPLLHPSLSKILNEISKYNFKEVILQTNGVLLTQEKINLIEPIVTTLLISFHSSDETIYNRITNTNSFFRTVITNIKLAISSSMVVNISYVINNFNYKDIYKDFKYLSEDLNGINFLEIGYNYKIHDEQKVEFPRLYLLERYLHEALDYLEKNNVRYLIAYCGLPLCYLNGHERRSSQVINYIENNEFPLSDPSMMIKSRKCSFCSLNYMCYGLHKPYHDKYNDIEIYPLFIEKSIVLKKQELS